MIDAGNGPGLIVECCSHLRLSNLSVRGSGRKDGNTADGILLKHTSDTAVNYLEVTGFRGAGIRTFGDRNTRLEHIYARDNGFAGISVDSGQSAVTEDLYIGYCIAENNPGDPSVTDNHSGNGIVVSGVRRGLVEYCEAMFNGWDMPRDGNGPVGIWGWHSDDLTIQYCISHHNLSPGMDGGGFDFDGGMTHSSMQYNLSHHNAGAGYGLYQFAGAATWRHNKIRYNISLRDGYKNSQSGIHIWSAGEDMSDADVYGNLILNRRGHGVSYLHDVPGLRFWANRFITGGEPIHGEHRLSDYLGNAYSRCPVAPS